MKPFTVEKFKKAVRDLEKEGKIKIYFEPVMSPEFYKEYERAVDDYIKQNKA